ncbi:Mitogen-activated protein kinase [Podila verticillata]|nr:Mitogen-activated protein kinase [Podila verticillata]KFH65187.1 CMGC protein kinase [Podila verticillata NRRL 6337]
MARPVIPQLGYPCLASSNDSVALVGLGLTGGSTDSKNATYPIHSYSLLKASISSTSPNTTATFTLSPTSKSFQVNALQESRMICAIDDSNTLAYIYNDKVYIENPTNPALAAAGPLSGWNAARGLTPQVLYSTTTPGTFQWLGISNGSWTQCSVSAAGISSPTPAPVPVNLPTTGVNLIIHEVGDSFLVIYSNASTSAGARFKLGPNSVSSPILMNSTSFQALDFASLANVQNSESDYFLGRASAITVTAKTNLTATSIWMSSTRKPPGDSNGLVPDLWPYATAAFYSTDRVLIYGGQSNRTSNAWSFNMSSVTLNAGKDVDLYQPFQSNGDAGVFSVYTPPPTPVVEKKGLSTPAIIGIAVGAVALLMLAVLFIIFQRRNKKIEAHDKISMSVRDMHSKGATASTHSLIASEATGTPRGQTSVSTERPVENLTLRVPIVRYDGRDVARSVPNAGLGAVVLSQYRLGSTNISTPMVVIQLGENVDTAESVTLKWVRDEIVWQREAAMLNHIVNPAKIISLHQTMIIPAALEWRHILVLDAHDSTLDIRLTQIPGRLLPRHEQSQIVKAVIGGLVWCHQKDVVHLSICTGSLVLNENDEWVLWSFGGARFLNEAVGARQGALIGHEQGAVERNMAPELMAARRTGRLETTLSTTAMDAWSAGCVLFEVLTGQPLFRTEDAAEQASTGRFNAWKDRLTEIMDPQERRVVEGLLVLDPNYRLTLAQAEAILV